MRIIAGTLKHRVLPSPPGDGTRPSSDRLRERVFSVLEHTASLHGRSVLDLCAGSGALAFEALSRGAASALLVDDSAVICRQLRETAHELGVSDAVRIMRARVPTCIEHLGAGGFDLVFVDPPYALKVCNAILQKLEQCKLLAPEALIVFEHGNQEHVIPTPELRVLKSIEMGVTIADIFCYRVP